MTRHKIERAVDRLRFISLIAVFASGLGSILMFIIGAAKTVRAYLAYFGGIGYEPDASAKQTTIYIIQALDVFLIGLVLMIFSGAIYGLFIRPEESGSIPSKSWVKIKSTTELKKILIELVIVILMVKVLEGALGTETGDYVWENLVVPTAILMLALAYKFMGYRSQD